MKQILLLSFIAIFLNSCVDPKPSGCTDIYANNHDELADYDNGSCQYSGDIIFFYNPSTAAEFNEAEYDSLVYKITVEPVDSVELEYSELPNHVFSGTQNAPDNCNQSGYVSTELHWNALEYPELDNGRGTIITYQVFGMKSDMQTLISENSISIDANDCTKIEIFLTARKNKLSSIL